MGFPLPSRACVILLAGEDLLRAVISQGSYGNNVGLEQRRVTINDLLMSSVDTRATRDTRNENDKTSTRMPLSLSLAVLLIREQIKGEVESWGKVIGEWWGGLRQPARAVVRVGDRGNNRLHKQI
ncbi:hypothetical protein BDZ85DRAFT_67805 [Elsinoe ampelina]|uniref:Uncharacterized protein n=1 Tax=Elsinoe ampelina TaxID=302913 RepID=A0A6A6GIW9_9PEZI|nr:hypothetical protein BDZ85DRAFT_67805 [Elsinoe ampelina]